MVSVLDSHASDPGSNLTSSTNCLFFTEIFKKLALLARPILKSFLKFPCQELSEYVVGSSGGLHFTRLDSGEQWCMTHICNIFCLFFVEGKKTQKSSFLILEISCFLLLDLKDVSYVINIENVFNFLKSYLNIYEVNIHYQHS